MEVRSAGIDSSSDTQLLISRLQWALTTVICVPRTAGRTGTVGLADRGRNAMLRRAGMNRAKAVYEWIRNGRDALIKLITSTQTHYRGVAR